MTRKAHRRQILKLGAGSKGNLAALILIGALSFGLYVNTLGNGFVFDDNAAIVNNPLIRDLRNAPEIFARHYWYPAKTEGQLYRPLVVLSFAINYAFGGLNPFGYHFVNTVLHALVCLLVYQCVALMYRKEALALCSALLFAAHPIHTEAVAGIVGRSELMAALFLLLAFKFHLKSSSERKKRLGAYALSPAFFALALLSKENAIIFPLLIFLYDVLFAPGNPQTILVRLSSIFGSKLKSYMGHLAVTVAYLLVRSAVLGGLGIGARVQFIDNPVANESLLVRLLTAFKVIVLYLKLLVVPLNLSADYSYDQIPVVRSLLQPDAVISLAVIFAIVVLACPVYLSPRSSYPFLWLLVTLLPTANILFPIGTIAAERLLYLPSFSFSLLSASLLVRLYELRSSKHRPVAIATAAMILAFYSFSTISRNADWKDDLALFSSSVKASPRSAKAHNNLGFAYYHRGLLDSAISEYNAALEIFPGYADAHSNLGNAYLAKGLIADAVRHYKMALEISPEHAEAHNNLGAAYRAQGNIDAAIEEFKLALRFNPVYPDALYNLGAAHHMKSMYDEAIEQYSLALGLKPDMAEAYYGLADIYSRRGLHRDAIRCYELFIKHWRGPRDKVRMAQQRILRLKGDVIAR